MVLDPINITHNDAQAILRRRLVWLTGLRWHAIGGVLFAAMIGRYGLGMRFPVHVVLALAAGMFLYNFYYAAKIRTLEFDPRIAFRQIVLDVIAFSLILFVTGGFINPFFTFYFFIVILARIILTRRESLFITVFVTICFALQGLSNYVVPVDMKLSEEGLLRAGGLSFHVIGAPLSFVLTTAITAYFISVIMNDLRKREKELRAARRQAELELDKLDNILRHLETGMLVIGRQGELEWVNSRLEAWFGSEGKDEASACYRVGGAAKEYRRLAETTAAPDSERKHYFEMRLPTVGQGVRDFEIILTPIRNSKGEWLQLIELVLDVTEQKKNQTQWALAQRLAAIGQLAAGVAHEINTPLGTISILAEETREIIRSAIAARQCPPPDEVDEALQTIHQQILRCKEITQGLLNFSRQPERVRDFGSLNEIVHQAVELVRPKCRGVALAEKYDEAIPEILTETSGLQQVVFNLLVNAIDAVEGLEREKKITIATFQENNAAGVHISDNGCGIAEKDLPHIFEPFFTTKPIGKGAGLGLYVSYGTMQDLGGRLEIESRPGEGTTAKIWLPAHHSKSSD
ncbi:MAG: ATP-binding protein [Candidatus Omnitrophota bacterium]